jgi:hypothetical protein
MEEAYMDDAEFTIEQDINSIFTVQSAYMELNENIEDVSKKFNLPTGVIKRIVKVEDINSVDYLESLETEKLDSIYTVLVRNLGNNPKTDLINSIEKIVANRVS